MNVGWNYPARAPAARSSARTTSSRTAAISRTSCRRRRRSGTTSAQVTYPRHQGDVGDRRQDRAGRRDDDRHDAAADARPRLGLAAALQSRRGREVTHANIQKVGHAGVERGRPDVRARRPEGARRRRREGLSTRRRHARRAGSDQATNTGGGSDDIGDISWNVPTVTLRYPSNIPGLPGHNWANGIAMATPIAHKGVTAGAKVQAMTLVDLLHRSPRSSRRRGTTSRTCRRGRRSTSR